ncbi:hypothetical protein PO124_29220 [Bacillus licheniformis]|nr:hypothetical protein [Bacillus licheniformis]
MSGFMEKFERNVERFWFPLLQIEFTAPYMCDQRCFYSIISDYYGRIDYHLLNLPFISGRFIAKFIS